MLKMYSRQDHAGNEPEFWDNAWDQVAPANFENIRNICENDPLWPLFERTVVPDRLLMDGGCGPGQWVKYYHDRGCRTLGVDFAPRAIERLKRLDPSLNVRQADICDLPLKDGELRVYYSGGVVEHFEEGPQDALKEARRVIATDGYFLCSIPEASWLRDQLLYRSANVERMVVRGDFGVRRIPDPRRESTPQGWNFYQYAFEEGEFRNHLEEAGFRIEETFGLSVLWGLYEIPGVKQAVPLVQRAISSAAAIAQGWKPRASAGTNRTATDIASDNSSSDISQSGGVLGELARRILVREDVTVPVLGSLLQLARDRVANLRMYVARPN